MPRTPTPRPKTVTIRLSEAQRTWVEDRAAKLEVSVSDYLRLFVINEMKTALDK